MKRIIQTQFENHQKTISDSISLSETIEEIASLAIKTLKNNHKIFLFGNGGSAADAQHIAAELTGRFQTERKGLAAIALTTDTSAITSIANDYNFANIYARQIEALANENDLLIGISTSGNSENIVKAIEKGKEMKCQTVGFSGKNGGKLKALCDLNLIIPSDITAHIQETHILIGHTICCLIDDAFSE